MKDLTGFSKLKTVSGEICINDNPDLVSLHGLENLQTAGGKVSIIQNPELKVIRHLDCLSYTGGLWIYGNLVLTGVWLEKVKTAGSIVFFDKKRLLVKGKADSLFIQGNRYNPTADDIEQGFCGN